MAVHKANFKETEIRCLDLPNTNGTLVSALMVDGERVSKIINGKQIANKIVKSKAALTSIFNDLLEEHHLFRSLVGC